MALNISSISRVYWQVRFEEQRWKQQKFTEREAWMVDQTQDSDGTGYLPNACFKRLHLSKCDPGPRTPVSKHTHESISALQFRALRTSRWPLLSSLLCVYIGGSSLGGVKGLSQQACLQKKNQNLPGHCCKSAVVCNRLHKLLILQMSRMKSSAGRLSPQITKGILEVY